VLRNAGGGPAAQRLTGDATREVDVTPGVALEASPSGLQHGRIERPQAHVADELERLERIELVQADEGRQRIRVESVHEGSPFDRVT